MSIYTDPTGRVKYDTTTGDVELDGEFILRMYKKQDRIAAYIGEQSSRIASLEADRENLWKMLDNISTFGDMYKPEINGYFKAVNKECEKRSAIMYSPDGYILLPSPPITEKDSE